LRILDTDHCVAALRGQLDLTKHALPLEELGITATSVGELIHGAFRSNRPTENLAQLDIFLAPMNVIQFDEASAYRFGKLKAELDRMGKMIPDLDLQIAGIALDQEAVLVTHDRNHFDRVVEAAGLVVEDWLA